MMLIMFIIACGICYLVYWSVMRLPLNEKWKGIVLCILGLLAALLLANYFFGSGPGFPHFSMRG
jgi:multisubunit Na+/H+ antiporter MnhB subunit